MLSACVLCGENDTIFGANVPIQFFQARTQNDNDDVVVSCLSDLQRERDPSIFISMQ